MTETPGSATEDLSPGLATLSFLDPHLDGTRRHVSVPATAPRPLERAIQPLRARIWGAGTVRELDGWVRETHTTALLVLDGQLGDAIPDPDDPLDHPPGEVVHEWYADGVFPGTLLLGASMTKSALAHVVGRAVGAGVLHVHDDVLTHVPELAGTGWDGCTVEHLLSMTTGTTWVEDHRDPTGPATALVTCFAGSGGHSRDLLTTVRPQDPPGSRWAYSTADSQVLDWVRERATGQAYTDALAELWRDLGCVRDAVVAVDADGVALAGGGLAACAEDWLRVAALQLGGTAWGQRVLAEQWVGDSSAPLRRILQPGRLPSAITTHAGFGWHWWPLDLDGLRCTADGSRGQFGYIDRELQVVVLKTSLWPYADPWVDRQQRDLCYLGLPAVSNAVRRPAEFDHILDEPWRLE